MKRNQLSKQLRLQRNIAFYFLTLLPLSAFIASAQTPPTKEWDKRFGGSDYDDLYSLQQTADGGYILGGYSASGISGDKTEASRGDYDYWIVKTDASGNKEWDKRFGGSSYDYLSALQQTADGGYILGGISASGISGDKTEASWGYTDYWIVKTDASGNKEWDKRFGGRDWDILYSLQQTADGGYILGGYSNSGLSGDNTETSRGFDDYWIVKMTEGDLNGYGNVANSTASLDVFPNPATNAATIQFALAQSMQVNIVLFTVSGQMVETLLDAPADAGSHTLTLNTSQLAKGVYLLRFTTAAGTENHKVVVQ